MEDSIFTKMIKGEVPYHKVYEDERTLAFLTIGPKTPGHTLVIPKVQVDHLWDLDDQDYQAVMASTKKVAQKIREVLKPTRVGIEVAGLEVPHVHIHIFPFNTNEEFYARPGPKPADEELAAMAAALRLRDDI